MAGATGKITVADTVRAGGGLGGLDGLHHCTLPPTARIAIPINEHPRHLPWTHPPPQALRNKRPTRAAEFPQSLEATRTALLVETASYRATAIPFEQQQHQPVKSSPQLPTQF
jgi:hypothetical protein